jgi:multicomponent Na+:H+ antiporter subunit G
MIVLAGMFTLITAPVIANRVGRLAYHEHGVRDDLLTEDQLAEDLTKRANPPHP